MKTRKKINNKVPKAFEGALIGTGLSLLSGIIGNAKQKRLQEEEERKALLINKQNSIIEDTNRLQDFKEEGEGNINYYQAKGGKIDPKKKGKTTTTERPVNDKEAEANSYKNNPNSMFTAEGIKMLGFVDETNTTKADNLNYGKYKGLNYFNTVSQDKGNRVRVSPTKNNIRNASDFKNNIKYLQELNPNLTIESDYIETSNRMAKGGNTSNSYNTKGGELKPLSSDMEIAEGNKHNESKIDGTSGIKLLDKTGKPFVEIEDEETIKDGTKVYSDQSIYTNGKTYAQTAEQLSKKKGELEMKLNKGNSIQNSTARRRIEVLDKEEDALFVHQELSKTKKTSPIMADGGNTSKFAKGLEAAIPYLDNVTNAILTATSPKVPNPVLQKAIPLNTRYNVQPQLNEVDDAVNAGSKFIKDNTSNSAVARNEITSARLQGSRAKADIHSNQFNVETQLKNRNTQHIANITANNINTVNDNNTKKFARANDIQSRISANVSNAVGDYVDKKNFDAEMDYNKERLDVARQYDTAGTSLRADLLNPTEVNKLKTDDIYFNEQLERYKNYPRELKKLKALRGL